MRKIYSLFILSILALTMFVGCQMPTDGTVNELAAEEETTQTETTPTVNEYTITVVAPHGTVELDKTKAKAGETVKILKYIADEGYRFKSVNAYKDDNTLVEPNPDHTSFVMPSCNVKIVAEYEAISNDDNNNDDDPQIETPTEGEDDTGDGEEDPVDDTPTLDADETTYGFTKTVNYTVKANGQSLPGTKTGAELIALAKEKNLIKDTDYTINGTTVTLTEDGAKKFFGNTDNDNTSNGDDTSTDDTSSDDDTTEETPTPNPTETTSETYKVNHGIDNGNYVLDPTNLKSSYAVGETVTLPIKTLNYTAPTGLYLVKTYVTDADNKAVAVTYNKDHTVSFKMPDSNVTVRADFYDVSFEAVYDATSEDTIFVYITPNELDFDVGMCFTEKVFDNLEYIDGVYVFRVKNKIFTFIDTDGSYNCKITSTAKNYKLCAIVDEKIFMPNDGQIDINFVN